MKLATLPIMGKRFSQDLGKTIIEARDGGNLVTVFANGDVSSSSATLVNVAINEVGDTFVAQKDSKTMAQDGKTPLYKKGDTVTRQKMSVEFKSLTGDNSAAQFAQSASAFGLQLIVQMG